MTARTRACPPWSAVIARRSAFPRPPVHLRCPGSGPVEHGARVGEEAGADLRSAPKVLARPRASRPRGGSPTRVGVSLSPRSPRFPRRPKPQLGGNRTRLRDRPGQLSPAPRRPRPAPPAPSRHLQAPPVPALPRPSRRPRPATPLPALAHSAAPPRLPRPSLPRPPRGALPGGCRVTLRAFAAREVPSARSTAPLQPAARPTPPGRPSRQKRKRNPAGAGTRPITGKPQAPREAHNPPQFRPGPPHAPPRNLRAANLAPAQEDPPSECGDARSRSGT